MSKSILANEYDDKGVEEVSYEKDVKDETTGVYVHIKSISNDVFDFGNTVKKILIDFPNTVIRCENEINNPTNHANYIVNINNVNFELQSILPYKRSNQEKLALEFVKNVNE